MDFILTSGHLVWQQELLKMEGEGDIEAAKTRKVYQILFDIVPTQNSWTNQGKGKHNRTNV